MNMAEQVFVIGQIILWVFDQATSIHRSSPLFPRNHNIDFQNDCTGLSVHQQ